MAEGQGIRLPVGLKVIRSGERIGMVTRRDVFAGATSVALATTAGAAKAAGEFADGDFRRAVVIDGMGGVDDPYAPPGATVLSARIVAELKASGVTATNQTVNDPGNWPDAWERMVANIAFNDEVIADNPEMLLLVRSAADIRRAKREGKVGVIYAVQDTSQVGANLDRIAQMKGLGVRIVQLTYNLQNLSGNGSLEPGNAGISKLGRATIARIEKERLLVDFSHGGQRTIAEGLAATTRPPIISHTGCRALNDNPRNVGDAEMKACADRGGVVGIYWMPFLVTNGRPTGADLVRHMEHARNVCGEDHVSIGTDGTIYRTVIDDKARAAQKAFFDRRAAAGIAAPGEGPDIFNIVAEWDDEMRFKHLADGLAKTGWTSAQIDKALGANLLRIFGETFG
jgi:membrane dipeptidase